MPNRRNKCKCPEYRMDLLCLRANHYGLRVVNGEDMVGREMRPP